MAQALDYKKEYKDLYLPKETPMLINIPAINFVAVEGKGNPNDPDGEFQSAIALLYGISYALKMSKMGNQIPVGYFDYVVPPLEGLWWTDKEKWQDKSEFQWIAMIRLPEFATLETFEWAKSNFEKKKHISAEKAQFFTFTEGLCVQCMHIGSFDEEKSTFEKMNDFTKNNGLKRAEIRHHEIYVSDFRKTETAKLKTVLRVKVEKTGEN